MLKYSDEVGKIGNILSDYLDKGMIDVSKLDDLDNIIKKSHSDQITVINNSYLSADEQMVLFGALRNISQTASVMKEKLYYAHIKGENPTTAELAFELIPLFENLSDYIDDYFENREIFNLEKLEMFSRNLYKKAKKTGFAKSVSTQLEEEKIYENQIVDFVEKFNEKIISELELEDEIGLDNESLD